MLSDWDENCSGVCLVLKGGHAWTLVLLKAILAKMVQKFHLVNTLAGFGRKLKMVWLGWVARLE